MQGKSPAPGTTTGPPTSLDRFGVKPWFPLEAAFDDAAVPFRSAVTNPYFGEPVGPPAWISVALAVAAGAWAAFDCLSKQPTRVPADAA